MLTNWKARALAAEAKLKDANASLEVAAEYIEEMIKQRDNRAGLVSIERIGRLNRFGFVRHKKMIYVETYGTINDDVQGWKKELIDDVDEGSGA